MGMTIATLRFMLCARQALFFFFSVAPTGIVSLEMGDFFDSSSGPKDPCRRPPMQVSRSGFPTPPRRCKGSGTGDGSAFKPTMNANPQTLDSRAVRKYPTLHLPSQTALAVAEACKAALWRVGPCRPCRNCPRPINHFQGRLPGGGKERKKCNRFFWFTLGSHLPLGLLSFLKP
jgi:hypothetical protein